MRRLLTLAALIAIAPVQIAGAVDAQWSAGPEDAELEVLGANPSMTGASLRMGLPTAGPATVGVFDLMGRSVATIANQMASVLRKAGAASRVELAALYARAQQQPESSRS